VGFPGDITTITVTGTFLTPSGSPATGTVTFDPGAVTLIDSAGEVIVGSPVTETLNGSGQITAVLACTDDPTLDGEPFTYSVEIALDGMPVSAYPGKSVPRALGASVDLSTLLP
jgi:hypothetical protein